MQCKNFILKTIWQQLCAHKIYLCPETCYASYPSLLFKGCNDTAVDTAYVAASSFTVKNLIFWQRVKGYRVSVSIFRNHMYNFIKFSLHVASDCGLFLLAICAPVLWMMSHFPIRTFSYGGMMWTHTNPIRFWDCFVEQSDDHEYTDKQSDLAYTVWVVLCRPILTNFSLFQLGGEGAL